VLNARKEEEDDDIEGNITELFNIELNK